MLSCLRVKHFSLRVKHIIILCLVAAVTSLADTKEVHILAVNDMHANIDQFPNFATLVNGIRTKHPGLLLFSAGDNRTGNPVNDMHPEASLPMITLMNHVGFNLSAIGNHEFDAGLVALRRVVYRSHFRYVCANMSMPDTLRLHIEPYKMFEVDGVRIAVLGLVQRNEGGTPDTHPDNVKGITFRPPIETAKEYAWLRDRCDVFIVLVHDSYEEAIKLAEAFPQPDLIISGHSHTAIDHEAADTKDTFNNVLITQAGSHLKYATYIIVELEDGKVAKRKARLLPVPVPNARVQAMVNEFNNNDVLKRELTQAAADFTNCEELGCLMADALRSELGADIAFQNPGGVRLSKLEKGPVTVGTVYALDPFGNEAVEYTLTGEEVLRLITAAYNAEGKSPVYVSGIRYGMTINPDGTVKDVTAAMDGDAAAPFDLQRRYKVVMSSYLAAICEYEKADTGRELGRLATDLLIEYLQKQPSVDYHGVKRANVTPLTNP